MRLLCGTGRTAHMRPGFEEAVLLFVCCRWLTDCGALSFRNLQTPTSCLSQSCCVLRSTEAVRCRYSRQSRKPQRARWTSDPIPWPCIECTFTQFKARQCRPARGASANGSRVVLDVQKAVIQFSDAASASLSTAWLVVFGACVGQLNKRCRRLANGWVTAV